MKTQLIQRRKRIFNEIEEDSLVILHSGYAPFKSADSLYDFHVNRNFYYLTGIEQENVILVIGNAHGKYYEYIFVQEPSEYHENWYGHLLTKEEVCEISGVEVANVKYIENFDNIIVNHLQVLRYADQVAKVLYLDLWWQIYNCIICQNPSNCIPKRVNIIVCRLYLNKSEFFNLFIF